MTVTIHLSAADALIVGQTLRMLSEQHGRCPDPTVQPRLRRVGEQLVSAARVETVLSLAREVVS